MGKKRKKSKGRQKRQKREKSPEEVTSAASVGGLDSAGDGRAEVAADLEPDERQPKDAAADLDDEEPKADVVRDLDDESQPDVAAVIDLDDDLDDPAARADLIAAAAGLASEPAGQVDGHDDGGPSDEPPASQGALPDEASSGEASAEETARDDENPPVRASPDAAPDVEWSGQPDADAEYGTPPEVDSETPLIGPDALVALSEFRQEGVATVPGELVLDLGEATTPEERDRLLAAALAHVEMQDAIYRVPLEAGTTRRWKAVIAATLFVMALALTGLPPSFLVPDAPPPLTATETRESLHMALLMQAEQIEAFRVRSGRLPRSLSEVETALPGIRFVRSSDRLFQLIAYTSSGNAVVYDSASPDATFDAAAAAWTSLAGES